MNHLQNILKIGGSLGSFVLANSLDPSGCTGEIIKAITGNLASNFVANYAPEDLLKYLESPNPELNHDIEKLMIDSVEKAVQLVTVKYYQENPYDDKFVKKTLKSLIEDARIMPNDAQNVLMTADKDAWLGEIHEYIFRGQEDENGKLAEIEEFFKIHLKSCYELVFNEGLKDDKNEKPLKAFLIKSLNGLAEQATSTSEIQNKILEEIQNLKENKPTQSLTIAKSYFEKEFNKIDKKLIELLEIAKKTDGKIDLIYQFFGIIEQKIDKLQQGQDKIIGILENPPTKIPHYLTDPPFLSPVFLGRKDDLEAIKQKLFEENNLLLLVNGVGGVGKTSLATQYFHRYQELYTHVAWVLSEKSIANALLHLADKLNITFNDTDTTEIRAGKVISIMATLQKPCLLIIDNANEPEDLETHYQNLSKCSNFHLLLTSRITDFEYAESYKIEGLPLNKAIELFTKYYPRHPAEQDELFGRLYEAVDKNTLVIELLAKNLHLLNKFEPTYELPDLLQDLQNKGLLALSQSKEVPLIYQKFRKAKPQDVIIAMYDLADLNHYETRLLSVLAVLPAERITYQTIKTLLPNTINLGVTLQNLIQKGWIDFNDADSTLKCSPVIQEITRAKNQYLYIICEELINTLINKLDYDSEVGTLLNTTYAEGVLYTRFAESVVANIEDIKYNLAQLNERIAIFHKTNDDIEKGIIYANKDIFLSKKLVEQYPKNENFKYKLALSCEKLGHLQQIIGDLNKAGEYFKQCYQICSEHYNTYPNQLDFKNLLAISCQYLGYLQQLIGNSKNALEYYTKYNKLVIELYQEYPKQVNFKNQVAISHQHLGVLFLSVGNLHLALSHFEKFNNLEKELYWAFPNNQVIYKKNLAISYQFLGIIEKKLEHFDKALLYFEKETTLFLELYRDFPNNISIKKDLAISYSKLGELQQSQGNLDIALGYFEKYNQIESELYHECPNQVDFKNGLAVSYFKIGSIYLVMNQVKEGIEYLKKAETYWIELTKDFPLHIEYKKFLGIARYALAELE